uniref:Glucose-methanol-choline oxidoreductase N-terminal domain-containing protein n=1 Tax=Timema douglasi TaxID=61478 RepID=A0A7R8ZAY9_TIMDO|nr:unnamed protein product [Timema douglasi]
MIRCPSGGSHNFVWPRGTSIVSGRPRIEPRADSRLKAPPSQLCQLESGVIARFMLNSLDLPLRHSRAYTSGKRSRSSLMATPSSAGSQIVFGGSLGKGVLGRSLADYTKGTMADNSTNCTFTDTNFLTEVCSSNFATFMTLVGTLLTNTTNITDPCNRLGQDGTLLKDLEEYDFIVIGAGAAGPVITSRLSENTNWEVLLLEAGPEEPSMTEIPAYSMGAIGTAVDWQYSTQAQNTSCLSTGGICSWPRGKMIGGSMALQGMMYTRGNKAIYDDWADAGNDGWSYEEVLPYFIKAENNKATDIDNGYHGFDGPLIVNHFPYHPVISEDIVRAAEEIGYRNGDVTGKNQTGIAIALVTVDEGLRSSTPRMYLRPNKNRANLHVSINSHVTKILIHPKNHTAYAVQFLDSNNVTKTVYARKEIILSAGAIGSPHILLLSGVGPKEDLEKLDIEVLSDLPVGKNLHNHVSMGFGFTINDTATEELTSETLSQFIINRTGPLASTGLTQTTLFMTSQYAEEGVPDLQVFLDGYSASCSRTGLEAECSDGTIGTCGRRYINARPTNVWPRSRGYLTLNTTNPLDYPLIYPNYLTEQLDVNVLIDGIKQLISLTRTKALAKWDFQQNITPVDSCEDLEFGSDNYWECVIRRETGAENHQGGTCKMGALNDSTAVVDPQLKRESRMEPSRWKKTEGREGSGDLSEDR